MAECRDIEALHAKLLLDKFKLSVGQESAIRQVKALQAGITKLHKETAELIKSTEEKKKNEESLVKQLEMCSLWRSADEDDKKDYLVKREIALVEKEIENLVRENERLARKTEERLAADQAIYDDLSYVKERNNLLVQKQRMQIEVFQLDHDIAACADVTRSYLEKIITPLEISIGLKVATSSVENTNTRKKVELLKAENEEKSKLVQSLREKIAIGLKNPEKFKRSDFFKPSDSLVIPALQSVRSMNVQASFKNFMSQISTRPILQNKDSSLSIPNSPRAIVDASTESSSLRVSTPTNSVPAVSEAPAEEVAEKQNGEAVPFQAGGEAMLSQATEQPIPSQATEQPTPSQATKNRTVHEEQAERSTAMQEMDSAALTAREVFQTARPMGRDPNRAPVPAPSSVQYKKCVREQKRPNQNRSAVPSEKIPKKMKIGATGPNRSPNLPVPVIDLTSDDESVSSERNYPSQLSSQPDRKPLRTVTFANTATNDPSQPGRTQQPGNLKRRKRKTNRKFPATSLRSDHPEKIPQNPPSSSRDELRSEVIVAEEFKQQLQNRPTVEPQNRSHVVEQLQSRPFAVQQLQNRPPAFQKPESRPLAVQNFQNRPPAVHVFQNPSTPVEVRKPGSIKASNPGARRMLIDHRSNSTELLNFNEYRPPRSQCVKPSSSAIKPIRPDKSHENRSTSDDILVVEIPQAGASKASTEGPTPGVQKAKPNPTVHQSNEATRTASTDCPKTADEAQLGSSMTKSPSSVSSFPIDFDPERLETMSPLLGSDDLEDCYNSFMGNRQPAEAPSDFFNVNPNQPTSDGFDFFFSGSDAPTGNASNTDFFNLF